MLETGSVLTSDLAGRTVIVTGGAGGLGRATCARFAACGATVAVTDIDGDAAKATAAKLGSGARGYQLDVSEHAAVKVTIDQIERELGGPHVLVNFAGGSLDTPRDLAEISSDDFDLVLGVNLRGTFLCCQAVAPYMIEIGGGSIVTVSSIGGRSPSPVTGTAYAAAKAGVIGLTKRLARELGPAGIRVNAIAPGLFLSGERLVGMWEKLSRQEQDEVLDAIPLRRMPEPHEVADPVVFLASDMSSYITGAVLDVNGGRLMSG